MSVQQEFDDLARKNSWQVDTTPGKSVYARGTETVTLRFNEQGTALTGADRTVPFDISAKDWRGTIGNILRRRWRTYEPAGGAPASPPLPMTPPHDLILHAHPHDGDPLDLHEHLHTGPGHGGIEHSHPHRHAEGGQR